MPANWMPTIWRIWSGPSGRKTTVSSMRLRNSGRSRWRSSAVNSSFSASISASETGPDDRRYAMTSEPMLLVMMMSVFEKSTTRPFESVRRPSSSTWSRMFETSGCAFSNSSSSTTEYGPAADGLGELPALVVADVARRRADEPRDGVALLVLGHVDAHERVLVVEELLGERLRELRLADAGRAQEDERAERAVPLLQAGAAAPDGVRDGLDGLGLPDDARGEHALHPEQLLALGLEHASKPGCPWRGPRHPRCPRRRPPP